MGEEGSCPPTPSPPTATVLHVAGTRFTEYKAWKLQVHMAWLAVQFLTPAANPKLPSSTFRYKTGYIILLLKQIWYTL